MFINSTGTAQNPLLLALLVMGAAACVGSDAPPQSGPPEPDAGLTPIDTGPLPTQFRCVPPAENNLVRMTATNVGYAGRMFAEATSIYRLTRPFRVDGNNFNGTVTWNSASETCLSSSACLPRVSQRLGRPLSQVFWGSSVDGGVSNWGSTLSATLDAGAGVFGNFRTSVYISGTWSSDCRSTMTFRDAGESEPLIFFLYQGTNGTADTSFSNEVPLILTGALTCQTERADAGYRLECRAPTPYPGFQVGTLSVSIISGVDRDAGIPADSSTDASPRVD